MISNDFNFAALYDDIKQKTSMLVSNQSGNGHGGMSS
jgi:hypothetical protein